MEIKTQGAYEFGNFILLSALMNQEDAISTSIHEYTHFILSNQSVYGTILYRLKKLIIVPNNRSDILKQNTAIDFFVKYTREVQEGMAVFAEAAYFLLKDRTTYTKFIQILQKSNSEYYGYIRPLRFILDMIEDKDRNTIALVTHAVFQVALEALNADIYTMDGSSFGTTKTIKKYLSRPDFVQKYLPSKRFHAMIQECNNVSSCEELIDTLWSKVSHKDEEYSVAKVEERLQKTTAFVLAIFSGSEYISWYKNSLDQIHVWEKDISDIFLQQLPTVFDTEYIDKSIKKVHWETIKEKCRSIKYSTLFIPGKLKDNLSYLLKKMGAENTDIAVGENELLFFYNLEIKEVVCCTLTSEQLDEILLDEANKSVLVTSYKNYDYQNSCIPGHTELNRFTYIYCDRTYINTKSILNLWKDKLIFYRYIAYESMCVLLIKNSHNSIFFLPMTPVVVEEAQNDILNHHKNFISMIDEGEFDSQIITDYQKLTEIDTVINCLFFIHIPVQNSEL